MKELSRREFCSMSAALGAIALSGPRKLMAQPSALEVELTIDSATNLAKVPLDYMGLSYESGQLAYPDFFSPRNTALIQMFRTLNPAGVLRLGGNLSEFTLWSEMEPATPPDAGGLVGPDPGHREPRTFNITPHSIRNLQGFLSATGWRCIYGLNLGGGTLQQALAEGGYVARTLGRQLIAVQFGNEPEQALDIRRVPDSLEDVSCCVSREAPARCGGRTGHGLRSEMGKAVHRRRSERDCACDEPLLSAGPSNRSNHDD
jgi:hypothetical protein